MATEALAPGQPPTGRREPLRGRVAALFRQRSVRLLLLAALLLGVVAAAGLLAAVMRIERIAMDAGVVYVTDLDWEGRVVEVEGYDRQLRQTRLIVHLRTGEVLARWDMGLD